MHVLLLGTHLIGVMINNPDVTPLHMCWNKDTKTWASRSDGFNEVGCVYSAQGAEFDYVGVVIGRDLVFDESRNSIEIDVEGHATTDHTYMPANFKRTPENIAKAKRFISNAYKVLLTRGIKGCVVYCQDDFLRQYLEQKWDAFKQKYSI